MKELGIVSDDMFERHPTGFGKLLKKFHQRYGLPIYITEHGAASSDEDFRIRDLTAHLLELHAAINHGVDVRGFFYWSLLDNFEWQFGYTKKFGLLSVDFSDEKLPRKMTRVGEFYRGICRARRQTAALVRQNESPGFLPKAATPFFTGVSEFAFGKLRVYCSHAGDTRTYS